jgi:hypothetical protein
MMQGRERIDRRYELALADRLAGNERLSRESGLERAARKRERPMFPRTSKKQKEKSWQ